MQFYLFGPTVLFFVQLPQMYSRREPQSNHLFGFSIHYVLSRLYEDFGSSLVWQSNKLHVNV